MLRSVFAFLKEQEFVLLFLVTALGQLLARLKWRGISLGIVASTLVVAMLGSFWSFQKHEIAFELPQDLQTMFFNLYIFCVGLRVGPQCFAGLEKNGRQFLAVAMVSVVLTPVAAILCGWAFQMDAGTLAGIVSGSNTASAAFGAAQSAATLETVGPTAQALAANLSVSFALGYAVSLIIFVLVLPYFRKLSRSDTTAAAAKLEHEMTAGKAPLPQTEGALDFPYGAPVDIRVYRVRSKQLIGKTIASLQHLYPQVSVEQIRREGKLLSVNGSLALDEGDEVALGAALPEQLRGTTAVGEEVDAPELRVVHPETSDVVITRPELAGKSLDELRRGPGHGLHYSAAFRMGEQIPLGPQTRFNRNDVLRVTGSKSHVDALAAAAGDIVRTSVATDLFTVAAGLVLGSLLGAVTVPVAGIKLGIGTAAGLLLVSIVMSWLRTLYPTLGGPFPEPARQLLEDLGLGIFISIVGLNAGPGLVTAIGAGTVGPILVSTLIVGFVPAISAWYFGIYVLKLNPALLLGAVAGARQSSPGLKVAQDSVRGKIPAVGFPVPFTVTTLVFTFLGYLTMVLWPIK